MGAPPMAPFRSYCNANGNNNLVNDSGKKRRYSAQTCVKSGYITSSSHYVIKVASGGHPFPANSGSMQLYSQRTGRLECILLDEGLLTELRTAAVGAVAAQMLAPGLIDDEDIGGNKHRRSECGIIGMVGTGVQARFQLQYLAHITKCRDVLVWGRTRSNVQQYMNDMEKEGWNIRAVDDVQTLMEKCTLIVTTTSSRQPLLKRLSRETHTANYGVAKGKEEPKLNRRPLHINHQCLSHNRSRS